MLEEAGAAATRGAEAIGGIAGYGASYDPTRGADESSAVEAAARASGSDLLGHTILVEIRTLERGGRLESTLRGTGFFSDAALRQAQSLLEAEEVSAGGTKIALAAGGAAFLVIGVVMIWHIISFWASYFNQAAEMGLY